MEGIYVFLKTMCVCTLFAELVCKRKDDRQVKSSGSRFNALFTGTVGEGQRASTTHTHLLLNRVHQFHASFFTSHVIIYKLLNRRVTGPSGAHVSPCLVDLS